MKNLILIIILSSFVVSCNSKSDKEKILKEKEIELLEKEKELVEKQNKILLDEEKANKQRNDSIAKSKVVSLNLDFLIKYKNKSVSESRLFQNGAFIGRLKKLLGKSVLDFMINYWNVEGKILIQDNIFIAEGCQAHNCGETNFIITYDFITKVLAVGVREDGRIQIYSEDGSRPQPITDWANY